MSELSDLYKRVMGSELNEPGPGLWTVRIWDGMDGCWTDLDEATSVPLETALQVWADRTQNGTKAIRFNEIDYYRIFPTDIKMFWDGLEGREMCGEEDATLSGMGEVETTLPGIGQELPLPMDLICPACGLRHIDEGEWATRRHKTHRCVTTSLGGPGCGHEWRPSERPTVGV